MAVVLTPDRRGGVPVFRPRPRGWAESRTAPPSASADYFGSSARLGPGKLGAKSSGLPHWALSESIDISRAYKTEAMGGRPTIPRTSSTTIVTSPRAGSSRSPWRKRRLMARSQVIWRRTSASDWV